MNEYIHTLEMYPHIQFFSFFSSKPYIPILDNPIDSLIFFLIFNIIFCSLISITHDENHK